MKNALVAAIVAGLVAAASGSAADEDLSGRVSILEENVASLESAVEADRASDDRAFRVLVRCGREGTQGDEARCLARAVREGRLP